MSDDGRPEIGRRIADAQERMVDQLDATRGARRARFVAAAKRPTRSKTRLWIPVAVTGLVAATALFLVLRPLDSSLPEDPAIARAPDDDAQGRPPPPAEPADEGGVRIDDGAIASLSTTATDTKVVLKDGSVQVQAHKGSKRRVEVRAGDFRVTSEDADATVRWDAETDALVVEVSEGEVVVESLAAGTQQTVVAGDSVHLAPADMVEIIEGPRIEAPKKAIEKNQRGSTWRGLAAKGKNADAVEAAVAEGYARVLKTANAADLLSLARAARYSKNTKRAKDALLAVRRRFAKSSAAARAAYMLGRIAADNERDHAAAAKWFSAYLTEQPRGALAREALGRLVESQRRSGASTAAKASAQTYLDRYPDGPHADVARKALK